MKDGAAIVGLADTSHPEGAGEAGWDQANVLTVSKASSAECGDGTAACSVRNAAQTLLFDHCDALGQNKTSC